MVSASVGTGDRPRGKSSTPIRFQPLQAQGIIQIVAIVFSDLHVRTSIWPCRLELLPRLLNQLGNQSRPPCLMAGTNSGTVIAMEVFVKRNGIPPERIVLKLP